jgi:Ricin-type beta-trefoil lectin domain-like
MKLRRTFATLLACVATSAMIMLATPSARAAGPSSEAPLPLVNFGSSKCFEPTPLNGYGDPNAIDANGLFIQQRTCQTNLATQYYTFIPIGYVLLNAGEPHWWCPGCITWGTDGYFIQNKSTGLCMDARDGATNDWSVVQQWTCRNKDARSMVWYIDAGDFYGAFKVRNFNSDLCLDVRGGSSDEYAQLQQYHCTSNNPAQNFNQPPV